MAYPQIRASITSAATETNGSSVVCTHPTGLTAGDLMVLFVGIMNGADARTITTPSGWTSVEYITENDTSALVAYKKIATSDDVSAGSTTVSFVGGTVDKNAYGMFAITGAASGNEITLSDGTELSSTTVSTIAVATSLTPIVPESLVFSAFHISENSLAGTLTASSFSLTPTTTMSERVDVGVRDGASEGMSLFISSGEYAGQTEITSRAVSVSESVDTGLTEAIILIVNSTVNATGTNAVLSVSPANFSQNGIAGTTGTNALLEISPEFPTQSGRGTSPTQWSNDTKPTTNWSNET